MVTQAKFNTKCRFCGKLIIIYNETSGTHNVKYMTNSAVQAGDMCRKLNGRMH